MLPSEILDHISSYIGSYKDLLKYEEVHGRPFRHHLSQIIRRDRDVDSIYEFVKQYGIEVLELAPEHQDIRLLWKFLRRALREDATITRDLLTNSSIRIFNDPITDEQTPFILFRAVEELKERYQSQTIQTIIARKRNLIEEYQNVLTGLREDPVLYHDEILQFDIAIGMTQRNIFYLESGILPILTGSETDLFYNNFIAPIFDRFDGFGIDLLDFDAAALSTFLDLLSPNIAYFIPHILNFRYYPRDELRHSLLVQQPQRFEIYAVLARKLIEFGASLNNFNSLLFQSLPYPTETYYLVSLLRELSEFGHWSLTKLELLEVAQGISPDNYNFILNEVEDF